MTKNISWFRFLLFKELLYGIIMYSTLYMNVKISSCSVALYYVSKKNSFHENYN